MKQRTTVWNGEECLKARGVDAEVARLRMGRSLREFERVLNRMERETPFLTLMTERAGKPFLEAWIALHFGRAIKATHARLATDCAPDDFYLRRPGIGWQEWQATEAMLEGRRRSADLRAHVPQHGEVRHIDDDEIQRQSAGALPALLNALERKKAAGGRLVIYWNTGWLIGAQRFIDGLRQQSEPFRAAFIEAWIMGKSSLFRVAPDFQMVNGPPTAFSD